MFVMLVFQLLQKKTVVMSTNL